jgi:hypothetical protein
MSPRLKLLTFTQSNKYRVGDKVYLSAAGRAMEGPYRVSSVPSKGMYRLEDSAGESVGNGAEYKEADLTRA